MRLRKDTLEKIRNNGGRFESRNYVYFQDSFAGTISRFKTSARGTTGVYDLEYFDKEGNKIFN